MRNSPLNLGKIPPQVIDAEEAVLGAILLEHSALERCIDILEIAYFYKEQNKKLYQVILALKQKKAPIDIITATNMARQMVLLDEIGGAFYISELTNKVCSSAHIEYHSLLIMQCWMQRELAQLSQETQTRVLNGQEDIFDVIDITQESINKIRNQKKLLQEYSMDDVINLVKTNFDSIVESGIIGKPSGLYELDKTLSGFTMGSMTIVAGRPGMGKTSLAKKILLNNAQQGTPSLFISIEMPAEEQVRRMISSKTGISYNDITRYKLLHQNQKTAIDVAIEEYRKLPIYINDQGGLTLMQFESIVTRMVEQKGIELVVIDYLQLMKGSGNKGANRENDISEISRGIKAVAKNFKIPIIALSQLSRQVEDNPGKRPAMHNLRESGSLEQDADAVILIYRPEYYNYMADSDGNSLVGTAELIVAKNRNGSLGTAKVAFNGETTTFSDINPHAESYRGNEYVPTPF